MQPFSKVENAMSASKMDENEKLKQHLGADKDESENAAPAPKKTGNFSRYNDF